MNKVSRFTLALVAGILMLAATVSMAQTVSVAPKEVRTLAVPCGTTGIGAITNAQLDEVWFPISIGQDVGQAAGAATNVCTVTYTPRGSTVEYRVAALTGMVSGSETSTACSSYPPYRYGDVYKFTNVTGTIATTNVTIYLMYGKTFTDIPR